MMKSCSITIKGVGLTQSQKAEIQLLGNFNFRSFINYLPRQTVYGIILADQVSSKLTKKWAAPTFLYLVNII